jgi:hypothetical protein
MWPMDISTGLDFAATPQDVYTMMTDQAYLEQVCVASESLSYDASVNGSSTRTSRTLASPDSAARFTGPQLTVVEEVQWGDAETDGARTGSLTMTVLGQPVRLNGRLQLRPGGRGTTVDLTGELKVAIPLLGRKMEESAAPAVLAGFRTQQRVGDSWLAGDRS